VLEIGLNWVSELLKGSSHTVASVRRSQLQTLLPFSTCAWMLAWVKATTPKVWQRGTECHFSKTKTIIYPSFSPRIGFRSEHCGFGRDWTWTFHCFSIGYLRAGVLLLLHLVDHFSDHFANEHIHDPRSRLCSGLRLGQKNLFVTFATIPTPSRVRWHGVLLYLSLLGKSFRCL